MAILTSSNVAQTIVKLVAPMAMDALVANLVMGALVNRDYEPTLAQAGDTVNITIPPVMTANNIAEGGNVTYQTPSAGNAQIVLNYHNEASFQLPDVTKAIAVPDLIKVYMQPAVNAIAEQIETNLLSLYANFTVNTAAGSSASITEAVIETAETALFAQKIPKQQPKFLILSGTAYSQLRQIATFRDWNNLGPSGQPSPIISGLLPGGVAEGKIKDFFVYRSQLVAKPSSTTYNVAFARDGIGLVVRRLPIPVPGLGAVGEYVDMGGYGLRIIMSYDPTTLSQRFTVDTLYGCGVLRNSFGIQVQSN